jgi:O-antigen/teichoic acid export membrane protein
MLNTIKRLTKHSFVYGIGNLAVLLPGFILVPVYTRRLATEEYGVMSLAMVFAGMLAFVYELGMVSALSRQYYEYKDGRSRNRVVSTAFIFLFIWAVIVTLGLSCFSKPLSKMLFHDDRFQDIVSISLLYIFFSALIYVPSTTLRVEERSGLFVTLSMLRVTLTVLLTVMFLSFAGKPLSNVFWAMLWATAVSAAIYIFSIYKSIDIAAFSSIDLVQMLKFGLAFFPAAIFTWIIDYSNRYILSLYADMGQVGVYSLGQKISQVAIILIKAFHLACVPIMFSLVAREDARRIFSGIFTYFIFVLSAFVLALCLYSKELVLLLSNAAYLEAYKVIPVMAVSAIGYGAYLYFVTGLSIAKKVINQPVILAVIAAVNIPLNIALIKRTGMMGAALATFLTYVILVGCTYFFAQRHYRIEYENKRLIKIFLNFAVIYSASILIRLGFPAANAWLFNPFLLAMFFILLYVTGFFKRSEIDFLVNRLSIKRG